MLNLLILYDHQLFPNPFYETLLFISYFLNRFFKCFLNLIDLLILAQLFKLVHNDRLRFAVLGRHDLRDGKRVPNARQYRLLA